MRANLPDPDYFLSKTVPDRPDVVLIQLVGTGNDGLVFRAHSSSLQRDLACKVIPRANLAFGPDGSDAWKAEVHKADLLRSQTVVKFEGIHNWSDEAAAIDCVALLSEFVDGVNLRSFVSESRDDVTISFIVELLKTILNLFNEMKQRGVSHGDLHFGNILVEDRSAYDVLGPRFVFRVTDFGVTTTSTARFKDDYIQLAHVVRDLLATVDYAECRPKDRFIFDILRHTFLARHLVEVDVTHDPLARQPAKMIERLQALDAEFNNVLAHDTARLVTPFDFLSCEQIGDAPALLHALYSDRFLGLAEIKGRNNVVVTGPRGCGKSTVFRCLSLDQLAQIGGATPNDASHIGVYYRCDDLYFAFPRYSSPRRPEAVDIPVHYVTATLLATLLGSLQRWATQHFEADFYAGEAKAAATIWQVLGLEAPKAPGRDSFTSIIERLGRERRRAVDWHRFANDAKRAVGRCLGPEHLQRVCEVLAHSFLFVRERPIYFFIDDYSAPKVTKDLQKNLNRVFMQRTPFCFFKLSTESPVSYEKSDIDGKSYVENREYVVQNLGIVYLHAELDTKLGFIEDVFRRRLTSTREQFPAQSLSELVGTSGLQNNNEMARRIREGSKPELWGKELLCQLCSGDIHYVINLVSDMVRVAGGREGLAIGTPAPLIQPNSQNKAIRDAAGAFLRNLRSIPRCGDQLVAICRSVRERRASSIEIGRFTEPGGATTKAGVQDRAVRAPRAVNKGAGAI